MKIRKGYEYFIDIFGRLHYKSQMSRTNTWFHPIECAISHLLLAVHTVKPEMRYKEILKLSKRLNRTVSSAIGSKTKDYNVSRFERDHFLVKQITKEEYLKLGGRKPKRQTVEI